MYLCLQDGSHIETYEGAGRIMLSQWNSASDKVVITTYKVATVLEVNVDTAVRSKRKEKDLKALSELLTKEEKPKKDQDQDQSNHKAGGDVKSDRKSDKTKHDKKHKKKKHR